MKNIPKHVDNQGFVLVAALFIIVLLSFIGIMSMENTNIEKQIATNDKWQKTSFYRADSGPTIGGKLILQTIAETTPGAPQDYLVANSNPFDATKSIFQFYGTSASTDTTPAALSATGLGFYNEIYGFAADEATLSAPERDVEFQIGTDELDIVSLDIVNAGAEHMDGNNAEFPPPPGAPPGIIVFFDINSTGVDFRNAQTVIQTNYGYVP